MSYYHLVLGHLQTEWWLNYLLNHNKCLKHPIKVVLAHTQQLTPPPPSSAAYMRLWTGSALVQIMACRLFGAKPSPEPMLTYCLQMSMKFESKFQQSVHLRHNGRDGVSNHQPHDCLLNHLFRRKSKKTSKLCVTGLCAGNSPGIGEFPAQMASNAENISIWWRHHVQWKQI